MRWCGWRRESRRTPLSAEGRAIRPAGTLSELTPERRVAGGEQCVLSRVPTQEMTRACVCGVMLERLPNLVKQEEARLIGANVQVELDTAFLLARRRHQRAEFRFQKDVLAFARSH